MSSIRNKPLSSSKQSWEQLSNVITSLQGSPIIDGVLKEQITLTSGNSIAIPHLLRRRVRGWVIVRKNANVSIWEQKSPDNNNLYLISDGDVVINLWIF